ncbi:SH3 domain-containing protein [Shewanella xiamenensis]|uniref:SH3 domain-containing protein n=1 Tax=Shewanella xiamenensis TaxID=332186 RepID=UPI001558E28F|nr:SH3 domain-containing protein [Shewanella xiamenensis]
MNRLWILLLVFVLGHPISIANAKNCKKGQPCGNSCISWSKTCRIGSVNTSASVLASQETSHFKSPNADMVSNPVLENGQVYEVTIDKLNIRNQPKKNAELLGALSKGERINVLAASGDWKAFLYQDKLAWVFSKHLKAV